MDVNSMNDYGTRRPPYANKPERFHERGRFTEFEHEEQATRYGMSQRRRQSNTHNEGPLSPSGFADYDCYAQIDRRPERRSSLFLGLRHQYGEHKAQDRLYQSIARRLSAADRHRNVSKEPRCENDGVLPFDKAMRWLLEGLVDAERFFQNLQDDYDKEIWSIKNYAGAKLLKQLWITKVAAKGPLSQGDCEDHKPPEKWEEKIAEKKKSLHEAMKTALSASLSLGDQEIPRATTIESRKRLQEKLETSVHHVMELLDLVVEESDYCKALLGELKLLREMVDPKKKENKRLFEGVDGEATGGGQGNGASYGDGGGNYGGNDKGYHNDVQAPWDG